MTDDTRAMAELSLVAPSPANHVGQVLEQAQIAESALRYVRDALEVDDLTEAADAAGVAAEAARQALTFAVEGLRIGLAPLEIARAARAELRAAEVPELQAPRRAVATFADRERLEQEGLVHAAAWERFRAARHAIPAAERALSDLARDTADTSLCDGIEAALRASSSAAEAVKLLAQATGERVAFMVQPDGEG